MTVSYNLDVSSGTSLTFFKLLLRWKGSIFKSVWLELLVWLVGYYIVFVVYRFCLNSNGQRHFEGLSDHLDSRLTYIPLTFMLGFFVSIVCDRWKQMTSNFPYIDRPALIISLIMRGHTEEMRLKRRTLVRYLVLTQVRSSPYIMEEELQILVFRDISMRVRRRFPNMESIVDAGFISLKELDHLKSIKTEYNKYWAPINWVNQHMYAIYKDWEKTKGEYGLQAPAFINIVVTATEDFRNKLETLCKFDCVPLPIAYPQVVFLAVRAYFVVCWISRQFHVKDSLSDRAKTQIDMFFPFMTVFQFVCIVGWMKVAEALLNPLGEDDDDLECNWLIDKNIATGMSIVDDEFDKFPPIELDPFVDDCFKPVYPMDEVEDAKPLIRGSAAVVQLAPEDTKIQMVHVDQPTPTPDFNDSKRTSIASILTQRRGLSIKKVSTPIIRPLGNEKKRSSAFSTEFYTEPSTPVFDQAFTLTTLNEEDEISRRGTTVGGQEKKEE